MTIRYVEGLEVRKYNTDNGFLCFSNSQVELQRVIGNLPRNYTSGNIQEVTDKTDDLVYYINVIREY